MFGLLIATGVTHAQGLVPATEPYQEWLEAACIMQPWSGERVSAMIEDRATWIPRLKDWGVTAVIFIPGPGDIRPHYPLEVMRAAIDDYHAAGIKVIMYWSIMRRSSRAGTPWPRNARVVARRGGRNDHGLRRQVALPQYRCPRLHHRARHRAGAGVERRRDHARQQ